VNSEPKLHHFVPQFHLARFADDRGRIWTLDKESGKIFPAGPNKVAAERHFYKLPEFIGTDVDPLFLEKQFADIEGEACKVTACWLRQLEHASKAEIPDVNRQIMSDFLALQFFRTADAREILKLFAETTGVYPNGVTDDEARSLHARVLCKLADGNRCRFGFKNQGVYLAFCSQQQQYPAHDIGYTSAAKDSRQPNMVKRARYISGWRVCGLRNHTNNRSLLQRTNSLENARTLR